MTGRRRTDAEGGLAGAAHEVAAQGARLAAEGQNRGQARRPRKGDPLHRLVLRGGRTRERAAPCAVSAPRARPRGGSCGREVPSRVLFRDRARARRWTVQRVNEEVAPRRKTADTTVIPSRRRGVSVQCVCAPASQREAKREWAAPFRGESAPRRSRPTPRPSRRRQSLAPGCAAMPRPGQRRGGEG